MFQAILDYLNEMAWDEAYPSIHAWRALQNEENQ